MTSLIEFFKTSANLKEIKRQGWIEKLSLASPESVADHCFSMAMMSMVISDLENYNSEKILKMTLLHDLAESEIGDFTPEQINNEHKKDLENNAFDKILKFLPESLKSQYSHIWKEYQDGLSIESKLVHQVDRLEMTLQAKIYQKKK